MSQPEPTRSEQLASRRQMLVLRSAQLRHQVGAQLKVAQPVWVVADRVQDAWLWMRAHPLAVAGSLLAVAVWRPRRTLGLALRLWSAWQLLQRARGAGTLPSRLH